MTTHIILTLMIITLLYLIINGQAPVLASLITLIVNKVSQFFAAIPWK